MSPRRSAGSRWRLLVHRRGKNSRSINVQSHLSERPVDARAAEQKARVAKAELDDEIRKALRHGVPVAQLARHAGMTPARVYQIRDRRR